MVEVNTMVALANSADVTMVMALGKVHMLVGMTS